MTTLNAISDAPDVLRVGSSTPVKELAGSLAHQVRRAGWAEMSCVGAAAVNQAVKASAIAVEHLAEDGISVALVPRFTVVEIHGAARTAMLIRVAPPVMLVG